jgi:hypothetical protein
MSYTCFRLYLNKFHRYNNNINNISKNKHTQTARYNMRSQLNAFFREHMPDLYRIYGREVFEEKVLSCYF